jgi:hypothetical protein
MWVNVYYSNTGEQSSFRLARVEEAHLISQGRSVVAPAAWVPGLGPLSLRRPCLLGYDWWVMITERESGPLGELKPLLQESCGEMA